jgi:hypothetical protein
MLRADASKSNTTNRKGYHASKFHVALQVRSASTCSNANAKANDLDVSGGKRSESGPQQAFGIWPQYVA